MQLVEATLETRIADADALFDEVYREEQARSELIALTDVVEEDPYRSLRTGLRDIEALAAKIAERGQLVPILVWLRRGSYVLLSGHRRVAALRHLKESKVKAIVYNDRDLSAQDALDIAIADNVDRNNFSKVEMAALVSRLVKEGLTQRQIAKRLRLSNGTVSDYFRLDGMPDDIKAAVDSGRVALRGGLALQQESEPTRARVLAAGESGMLSLGDVQRLIDGERKVDRTTPGGTPRRRLVTRGRVGHRPGLETRTRWRARAARPHSQRAHRRPAPGAALLLARTNPLTLRRAPQGADWRRSPGSR